MTEELKKLCLMLNKFGYEEIFVDRSTPSECWKLCEEEPATKSFFRGKGDLAVNVTNRKDFNIRIRCGNESGKLFIGDNELNIDTFDSYEDAIRYIGQCFDGDAKGGRHAMSTISEDLEADRLSLERYRS